MLKNNGNFTRRKQRNKLRDLGALEVTSVRTNAYFIYSFETTTWGFGVLGFWGFGEI